MPCAVVLFYENETITFTDFNKAVIFIMHCSDCRRFEICRFNIFLKYFPNFIYFFTEFRHIFN
ncbi:hypothetical protein BH18ACT7_BH18ACT7_24430 [soil metagenome]